MAAWNERGFMERQRLAVGFKTPAPHDIKHSGGHRLRRDGLFPGTVHSQEYLVALALSWKRQILWGCWSYRAMVTARGGKADWIKSMKE